MLSDLRRDAARMRNAGRLTYPWNILEAMLFDNGQAVVIYRAARWLRRREVLPRKGDG